MKAAEALAKYVGVKPACDALRVARATFYRRRRPSTGHQQPRPTPARALSEKEREKVFDTLCSERFVDRSPAEVVATLLDEHVTVRRSLKRMYRHRGCRQTQVQGLTWALRRRLLAAAGDRVIDVRNRAILAVAYDAMLRRSELVALQVVDVTRERGGSASLLVRRAKNDPEAAGAMLYLHRDSVKLLREWLSASGIDGGPLFRSLRKDGTVGGRLPAGQVPRIYKAMAGRAGFSAQMVRRISGHSPRVGAAQDMIASGIGTPAIMQAGRWKSAAMVQRYGERLLAKRNGAAQLARLQKRR